MKHKLIKTALAVMLSTAIFAGNIWGTYAATYYEKSTKETIGKGITYETINRVTEKGLLDIYVLKAPLDDPYIQLGVAKSETEFELKDKTSSLLQQSGAIAGVNADFFDLEGSYSATVGLEVENGGLLSANIYNNTGSKGYATFFVDNYGNPFIDYLRTSMHLYINDVESIKVTAVNKVTGVNDSVYLDKKAVTNTAALDARYPNTIKIVVEDSRIIKISQRGETVTVPQRGFIILLSEADAARVSTVAAVGQKAVFSASTSVDYTAMQMAISGGGKLLSNGATVADNGNVVTGNQPRTAVGYSADGREVIMMVVDGRNHSVGVTHDELAELMRKHGAYNAMHLDGGGSTAMAVRKPGKTAVNVINSPSGGAERKVANALGIYINAPLGVMTQMTVSPQNDKVFYGTGLPVSIFGNDGYFNTISLPRSEIGIGFNDGDGHFTDGFYYPGKLGNITISASYGGVTGKADIRSIELAALLPVIKQLQTGVGEETLLQFNGLSVNGETAYIYTGVSYEVYPANLGHMNGDKFVADNMGAGYIKCYVGDVVAYIDVNSGNETQSIYGFEGDQPVKFVGYPTEVTGNAFYKPDIVNNGKYALELTYRFNISETTQAAYMAFDTPLPLKSNPSSLKLMVFGDNSNHWLRARLLDANGEQVVVDLARTIDWEGWQQVEGALPKDVKYPVSLDRIYVAAVESTDDSIHTIYFDDLAGDVSLKFDPVTHPASTIFLDRYRDVLSGKQPANGVFQVAVSGNLGFETKETPKDYNAAIKDVTNKLNKYSSYVLYSGSSEIGKNISVKSANYTKGYNYTLYNNVGILQLTASQGGIIATDVTQWTKLVKDLNETKADHIVVYIDKSPLTFSVGVEYSRFQEIISEIVDSGKNVFVVYENAKEATLNVRGGVRYIGLANLWNADGSRNSAYRTLRFEIAGKSIKYDLF